MSIVSFVLSLIGLIFHFILSDKRHSKINSHILICRSSISDNLSNIFNNQMKNYKGEINRLIGIVTRELGTYIQGNQSELNYTYIDQLELKIPEISFQEFIKTFYDTNKHLLKLEKSNSRLKNFRSAFIIIVIIDLFLVVINITKYILLPDYIYAFSMLLTIIFVVFFIIDYSQTTELLNISESKYDIKL